MGLMTFKRAVILVCSAAVLLGLVIGVSPKATAAPSVGTKYTFAFTSQKSTLTSLSVRYFAQVVTDLRLAKSVRITAYAPNVGPTSRQRILANARVTTLVNFLKKYKITATVTQTTALASSRDRVLQVQGIIQVTSLKPKVVPSPSASSSISPSASPSATPSQTSLFTFSGKLALDFVDCNNFDPQNLRRQVLATSVTLTSVANNSLNYTYPLKAVDTDRDGTSNYMNCTTSWNLANVLSGTYNLKIDYLCDEVQSIDEDTPSNIACTPSNYLARVGSAALNGEGEGPIRTETGYLMSLQYPDQVAIFEDSNIKFHMWSNY